MTISSLLLYLDILFLVFLDKVLLSGLTGLHRAIIAQVRHDILFRSPKLGRKAGS